MSAEMHSPPYEEFNDQFAGSMVLAETEPADTIDATRFYLNQMGKVPLLRREQVTDLARSIEVGLLAGDRLRTLPEDADPVLREDLCTLEARGAQAKTSLVEGNLRLVVSMARSKRYTGRGLDVLDLIQEGNTGLMRAVERYDYAKGYAFSTYATWWIRQSLERAIAEQSSTIRVPEGTRNKLNKVAGAVNLYELEHHRRPTIQELAAATDMTPEGLTELQKCQYRPPLSLDKAIEPNRGQLPTSLAEYVSDPPPELTTVETHDRYNQIMKALGHLPTRSATTLVKYYGLTGKEPMTTQQIGEEIGLSRQAVRCMINKALKKLRDPRIAEILSDYAQ